MQTCRFRVTGFMLGLSLLGLAASVPAAAQPSPHAELPRPQRSIAPLQALTAPKHLPRRDQLVDYGIYRLDGRDPNLPQADLAPLRQILQGAQVVGLGESVHTVGGFYEMKHRLFRYMVEEMGFRAFAMETPWHYAEDTARYVATCQGSVKDAMRGIFGVWASTETGALLEYMCSWNQTHPDDPITFFGFDTQQPEVDGPALIQFLRDEGIAAEDPLIAAIRRCSGVTAYSFPVTDGNHQACLAALDEVDQLLEELDGSAAVQLSREDVEWAKVRAVGLRAWEGQAYYRGRNHPLSFNSRDRGMATAFQLIRKLKVGSQKTAVWAHNFHIAKGHESMAPYEVMGDHLERELGHRYAAVALIAYYLKLDWPGVWCGDYDGYPEITTEWDLLQLQEPFLLIDLDFNGTNASRPAYIDPTELQIMGGEYFVPEQFDALVYQETAPAMTPVFWPSCN